MGHWTGDLELARLCSDFRQVVHTRVPLFTIGERRRRSEVGKVTAGLGERNDSLLLDL